MTNPFGFTPEQMLGTPTLHLPLNMIVQNMGDGKVIGVFQTGNGNQLFMGSDKTHQLILGDVFIRPRLAFESDEFRGYGMGPLATDAFLEVEKWRLIFDRNGQ